jgi:general secretion pathway protein E
MDKSSTIQPDIDVIALVERLLNGAAARRASDVHIEPTAAGGEVRYRVDGLLERVEQCDAALARAIVNRLMVLARLLTYRLDVPQEGRATVSIPAAPQPMELRVAVMPTTHGLRCAVRLPAELIQPQRLEDLGLSSGVLASLTKFAASDAGMLIVTGPAGSGKTTTIYALLRHLAEKSPGLGMIALEDPVERDIPGVTQIEVKPFGELTYERCLRSILRQDPQVLMLGEIRDAATATLAAQAALSGHRLICTLHAASPGGAISRLLEMGLEPYQITSALFGVVAQRLLRRKAGSGYAGRIPVAEFVAMDAKLRAAVLRRADADELNSIAAAQGGYVPFRRVAQALASSGVTDAAEVHRVFGEF